jgi:putative lysine transport system substrate-binding protein
MVRFSKLLLMLVFISLIFSVTACKPNDTDNQFRVGMECAYPPFNWTQSDNANGAVPIEGGGFAGGYDVEIAKQIAAKLGKELVIVKTEWDGLEPALASGVIDAIIAGMSPTAERKARIEFSANYYTSDLVVVVRKDGEFADAAALTDFTGAKITAQQNTFHYTVIDQLTGAVKETAMPDFPTMITALDSGAIDGYISERPGAVSAMAANASLSFVSFPEGSGFEASEEDVAVAIGLKKGSPLLAGINEALTAISTETRQEMMDTAVENQPVS